MKEKIAIGVPQDATIQARSLEEINQQHVARVDKYFRMFHGLSSYAAGFHAGQIYLEVRLDRRFQGDPDEMVRKVAATWRNEPEFAEAEGYSALLYRTARQQGFIIMDDGSPENLAAQIEAMKAPAEDIYEGLIEDRFDATSTDPELP